MTQTIITDMYHRLLAINGEAFDAGLFDVAYHALASAMHCAEILEEDDPLKNISRTATQQLNWIDENHPEYEHSTPSTFARSKGKSIFFQLSRQADTMVRIRNVKLRRDQAG